MILKRLFCGCPMSFVINMTMDVSHVFSGDEFNRAIDIVVWCSYNSLSPKSWTSSEYCVLSGFNRLYICPGCRPEGEVVVASFQCLNPLLSSFNCIVFFISVVIISLFLFRLFRYLTHVFEIFSFDKSVILSRNLSEKLVRETCVTISAYQWYKRLYGK